MEGCHTKEFAEPDVELIENLSYEEAVQYLKKRDVLTKIDYDELNAKLKFRAFTASRINDGQLLSRINSALIKNVKDGNGLGDFLRMTKDDLLDKVGMGPNQGWYWETVYRTNVQTAYNAGRAMGFEEDNPLALELIAIDDARTTDFCRQFAGRHFILPYDDPFWDTHWPPFHFNCRSTVRAIYDEAELPDDWSNVSDLGESPAKGFGEYPVTSDSWWKELDSQVKQAKAFGLQEEIEAAREILCEGKIKGKSNKTSTKTENRRMEIAEKDFPIEKVENEIAGIEKGKPMSFSEADSGNVNPLFKPHTETADNCPGCVATFKARLDGFHVRARAYDNTNEVMDKLGDSTRLAFIDKKTGKLPVYIKPGENHMPRLMNWFTENLETNKYYSIEFYWKHSIDGHIMVIFKNSNDLVLYDPQENLKIVGNKIMDELYQVRRNTIKLINISDCFLNKHVVDYLMEAQL